MGNVHLATFSQRIEQDKIIIFRNAISFTSQKLLLFLCMEVKITRTS
jgi:hypothetical protein